MLASSPANLSLILSSSSGPSSGGSAADKSPVAFKHLLGEREKLLRA